MPRHRLSRYACTLPEFLVVVVLLTAVIALHFPTLERASNAVVKAFMPQPCEITNVEPNGLAASDRYMSRH